MKKLLSVVLLCSILLFSHSSLALEVPGPRNSIYTENVNNAINTDNIDNPLRDGTYMIIDNEVSAPDDANLEVAGVINVGRISKHEDAKSTVLQIIKNIINYALGMLGLVALVYLLFHGFMIVTAAGDEDKYKKGLKGVKYAAIALGGIGVSFFIMSFVFRLIRILTTGG